jgi:hypothetical protein
LCVLLPVSSEDMSAPCAVCSFVLVFCLPTTFVVTVCVAVMPFFSILVCPQYYLLVPGIVQCMLSWLVLRVREWHVVVKNAREDVPYVLSLHMPLLACDLCNTLR